MRGAVFAQSLACSAIAVPQRSFDLYVEAAKNWGANVEHTSESVVVWTEREHAEIEGTAWISDVTTLDFASKRAIIRLGLLHSFDIVAVVTSFATVTALLKSHIVRFLRNRGDVHISQLQSCGIDFSEFAVQRWEGMADQLNYYEARDQFDRSIVVTTPKQVVLPRPEDSTICSLGLTVNDIDIKIAGSFDMEICARDHDDHDVAVGLSSLLSIFDGCIYLQQMPVQSSYVKRMKVA